MRLDSPIARVPTPSSGIVFASVPGRVRHEFAKRVAASSNEKTLEVDIPGCIQLLGSALRSNERYNSFAGSISEVQVRPTGIILRWLSGKTVVGIPLPEVGRYFTYIVPFGR